MAGGYILFPVPLIFGLLAKLMHSKLWFGDYQAIACAGQKVLQNAPIYSLGLKCDGMHASSYVYIPIVAQAAGFVEGLVTERGFFWLYLIAFLASLAILIWFSFFSNKAPGHWRDRLPFMVFLSGSAFMWGNVAVILHGAILASVLLLETMPVLFITCVAISAWVKPVFLTYLIVILLADRPIQQRLGLAATGLIAGLFPTLIFACFGGTEAQNWFHLLSHFVYEETPGYGFFGWLALAGIKSNSLLVQLAYLVFAALIGLSGLSLSEGLRLTQKDRLWLALSLAALLIPRIMSQDVFLLAPGMIVVAQKSAQLLTRQAFQRGQMIVLCLCSLALLGGLTNLANVLTPLSLLGLCVYILYMGQSVFKERRRRILARMISRLRTVIPKSRSVL